MMNPSKVTRARLSHLTDLPNVGSAVADDLRLLGIEHPAQLIGLCPYALYERLNQITGLRHDPNRPGLDHREYPLRPALR